MWAVFLPIPRAESWFHIVLSVVLHVAYNFLLVLAYRHGDLVFLSGRARFFTAACGCRARRSWRENGSTPSHWLGSLWSAAESSAWPVKGGGKFTRGIVPAVLTGQRSRPTPSSTDSGAGPRATPGRTRRGCSCSTAWQCFQFGSGVALFGSMPLRSGRRRVGWCRWRRMPSSSGRRASARWVKSRRCVESSVVIAGNPGMALPRRAARVAEAADRVLVLRPGRGQKKKVPRFGGVTVEQDNWSPIVTK